MITIDLRSNLKEGVGVIDYDGCKASERSQNLDFEIDYCKILNANLPPNIQILAWAPCPKPDFSARFDCTSRTYKYYFPRGDLDLVKLNEAGQYLLGENDYRNFCKMDVANGVVNYKRRITRVEASAIKIQNSSEPSPFDMCCLTIMGRAFLWHQIRLEGQLRSFFGEEKFSLLPSKNKVAGKKFHFQRHTNFLVKLQCSVFTSATLFLEGNQQKNLSNESESKKQI